jgi:hypothetical protein
MQIMKHFSIFISSTILIILTFDQQIPCSRKHICNTKLGETVCSVDTRHVAKFKNMQMGKRTGLTTMFPL